MDEIPEVIETDSGTPWRRVRSGQDSQHPGSGVLYEYGGTGTLGRATGQLHAVVTTENYPGIGKCLDEMGLSHRVAHQRADGNTILAIDSREDTYRALAALTKVRGIEGVVQASAIVEMMKSNRDTRR